MLLIMLRLNIHLGLAAYVSSLIVLVWLLIKLLCLWIRGTVGLVILNLIIRLLLLLLGDRLRWNHALRLLLHLRLIRIVVAWHAQIGDMRVLRLATGRGSIVSLRHYWLLSPIHCPLCL